MVKSRPTALGPILEMAWPRFQHARSQIGEFDEDRTRVAWIDDLLDLEMLGGPERRSDPVKALFESHHQCLRVVRRIELGPIGGLQPPLDRQRTPVARRPGVAEVEARTVLVRGS